ncbi:MAG: PRC-barrel domain-containing protein [Patescibacteria group bacterium]|jgi:sporulation protein YlmC with PRC-barrel domain
MKISSKKLIHLPVFTDSGDELGKISELIINIDTHDVEQYIIKSSNLIEEFFSKELLVSNSQVISISKEKMIVEDSIGESKKKLFDAKELSKRKSAPPISL